MAVSLYRKWRPQNFSDIIGQDHVRITLEKAVASNRISHAYLFSGSRATGKTSTARILAKAINCTKRKGSEPCNKCLSCLEITEGRALDVIEIDAASTRGIDEIRDLRERVKFSPASLKYKIFIVDEVHMLTREAFNALLKTLEEPPEHAIFILITTEIHKIPQTIISRCQRFDFKRIKLPDLVSRLQVIAKKEKIQTDKKALELIAQNAAGGLRDAIGFLEQAASYGKKVTVDSLRSLLGLTDVEAVFRLMEFLSQGDVVSSLELVNHLVEEGFDMNQFSKNIVAYLRDILVVKISQDINFLELTDEQAAKIQNLASKFQVSFLLKLINLFIQAERDSKSATLSQLPLELAIIEAGFNINPKYKEEVRFRPEGGNRSQNKNKRNNNRGQNQNRNSQLTFSQVQKNWNEVLDRLKRYNHSIWGFLKSAQVIGIKDENLIVIEFSFPFHKEKIQEPKNLVLVEKAFSEVLGIPCKLKCALRKEGLKENKTLKKALEVFGGEVVE